APLVILADTTSPPAGPRPPRLLALPAPRAAPGTPDRIVWAGRKAFDVRAVGAARQDALAEAEHEYRRLLYVAMTRAADRLIVAGCEGQRGRNPGCWYDLVLAGLREHDGFETVGDGDAQIWRYRKVIDATSAPAAKAAQGEFALRAPFPTWLRRAAPAERHGAGGEARRLAIMRGTLIHRLMQALPDIAPAQRTEAARRYLARAGADLDAAEHDALTATALQIFADPRDRK